MKQSSQSSGSVASIGNPLGKYFPPAGVTLLAKVIFLPLNFLPVSGAQIICPAGTPFTLILYFGQSILMSHFRDVTSVVGWTLRRVTFMLATAIWPAKPRVKRSAI